MFDINNKTNVKAYKLPFAGSVIISNNRFAADVIMHYCERYCNKDAASRMHCSNEDSAKCDAVKQQIKNDWKLKRRIGSK